MFAHHFIYTIKTLFKNKSLIFWTFAFPIIMAILFNFAFSDLENNEKLEIFDIAIVNNNEFQNNEMFKNAFASLSDDNNSEKLFNIKYVNESDAKKLLENGKIKGYLILKDNEKKVVTGTNGVYETVLKYVVDEINESSLMISKLTEKEIENGTFNYNEISNKVKKLMETQPALTKDISKSNLSYTLIEFYSLIAMTCLYGGVIVIQAMNQSLANMSSIGKRVGVSPLSKGKVIISSILASFIIELIGVSLLIMFLILVLDVDFGSNLLYIIPLALAGTITGLAIGLFISVAIKTNENTKLGIIISVSMTFSILAGMTGIVLKYMIDKNAPLINKLNPASMITDGFYSLYYYDTLDRYIFNIISLLVFASIFILIAGLILRRQKYDSI